MSDITGSFGEIHFSGQDMAWPAIKYDRLAYDDLGRLLFLSCVADTGLIKGIRAALNCDKRISAAAVGPKMKRPSEADYLLTRPGTLVKLDGGYFGHIQRLAHGAAHAMFYTKLPGFLIGTTDDHLWQELTTSRFTTPLLRHWVPWIAAELRSRDLLREAVCYRCTCGVLHASTAQLDEIVSEGVRTGKLPFRRPQAA